MYPDKRAAVIAGLLHGGRLCADGGPSGRKPSARINRRRCGPPEPAVSLKPVFSFARQRECALALAVNSYEGRHYISPSR